MDDIRALEQNSIAEALPQQSTYELLRSSRASFGRRAAITFLHSGDPEGDVTTWSFDELFRKVTQYANALHALGIGEGGVQAILLPTCLEYQLGLWGGSAAGIAQPLNPLLMEDKLVSLLVSSGASVLLAWGEDAEAEYWSKAMRLKNRVPGLQHVIRVAPRTDACVRPADLPSGVYHLDDLMVAQPDDTLVSGRSIKATDIASYFHTGGTTGAPKLACHSHGGQVYTCWASVQLSGLVPDDVTISGSPQFHVAGTLAGSLPAIASGVHQVVPTTTLFRNRDVIRNYWKIVEKYKVTLAGGVPTVFSAICQVPVDGADISSLRYCRSGAALMPPEVAAKWERITGQCVHGTFGMTETSGITSTTPLGTAGPAGCVGFRLPYATIRIVERDAEGRASDKDVPDGQSGIILCKGPNVFPGYLDPQDSEHAFVHGGWLDTGDVGWFDDMQRLHISGRAKDIINRSGHNIDPKVIEDALSAHPSVEHAAAVGAPDAYAGELPVAFVQLLEGQSVSEEQLLDFAASRVDEPPARPKRVFVIDTMPLTNVGKIYKPELRTIAAHKVLEEILDRICKECHSGARPVIRNDQKAGFFIELSEQHDAALERVLRIRMGELPFVDVQILRSSKTIDH
ncbi:AMP-binding protein [uncultured Hyphomonas sp.]|uniref:AMP-binding protein n=1 Tax=uncultured Hyphomonas sp. TaxID=225298 RepID=UPI002AABCC22|nr:AMP-binding protein [uncultured Hyphomonas sp.]